MPKEKDKKYKLLSCLSCDGRIVIKDTNGKMKNIKREDEVVNYMIMLTDNFMIVYYFIVNFFVIDLFSQRILKKSSKIDNCSSIVYIIETFGNTICNNIGINVYRILLYVYEIFKYHEPVT